MRRDANRSPLLFEKDGDFNPGWLMFIGFSGLGAGMAFGTFVVALVNADAWPALIAGLSFVAFAMLITAAIVVPIARAKLLLQSKTLEAAMRGIAGPASMRVDNLWVDNETGDPEPVRDFRA